MTPASERDGAMQCFRQASDAGSKRIKHKSNAWDQSQSKKGIKNNNKMLYLLDGILKITVTALWGVDVWGEAWVAVVPAVAARVLHDSSNNGKRK